MNIIDSILSKVAEKTDSVILFSSITGKDSILLSHYCANHFKKVHIVYMYVVKDLQHIIKYQRFFENNYTNIEFHHVPHFTLTTYIRTGYMGIKKDSKQRKYKLSDIDNMFREKIGVEWSIYGMKQSDSLNRRLQLRGYDQQAINYINTKAYPLSTLSNSQVLSLIQINKLPIPIKYNTDRSQSQDISDIDYLVWLYKNYPEDLNKTFELFPATKHKFYEWQTQNKTE